MSNLNILVVTIDDFKLHFTLILNDCRLLFHYFKLQFRAAIPVNLFYFTKQVIIYI